MNIGLIDVDCLHATAKRWGATIYPNLALAKIARWHKQQGDTVDWYTPFEDYDRVYMSKIFTFSADFGLAMPNAKEIIRGGTGYDIASRLPDEIDRVQPDYSIYPNIPSDTAYGFLTRGCIRKCRWCVVPRKEGNIHPYMDVEDIAIDGRKKLVLMDNNILAAGDYAKEQFRKIIKHGYRIDMNQGLDARLVDEEWAQLLAKTKWIDRRIRFGCDTWQQVKDCERAMALIDAHGFKGIYFFYVMLDELKGFDTCYKIVNHWWERMQEQRRTHKGNHVYPHCQPYRDPDKTFTVIPQWQKDMASWTNKRMHFVSCSFKEFSPRKDFRCISYFSNNL